MGIKDLESTLSRLRTFEDELADQVEERNRMVEVLQLTPSANDNLDLISYLEKISRVMKYFEEDFSDEIRKDISIENYQQLLKQYQRIVKVYTDLTDNLESDGYIDVSEYKFSIDENLPEPIQLGNSTSGKSVRFKDKLVETDVEHEAARQELLGRSNNTFMPYRDDENDTSSIASSFDLQSNQQIFAQHQQQLLEQDDNLDILHSSVRRQHQMGLGINDEVDEHIILLNDLEQGIDTAHARLNRATNRLKSFQKLCKENGSLVTIVVLTIILIVLLVVLN